MQFLSNLQMHTQSCFPHPFLVGLLFSKPDPQKVMLSGCHPVADIVPKLHQTLEDIVIVVRKVRVGDQIRISLQQLVDKILPSRE